MNYSPLWKVLEEMLIELRKRDVIIPTTVIGDLKSAKVLMKIFEASEKDRGQTALKIEQYLGNVEAYLATEAEKKFESAHISKWLERLEEARGYLCERCGAEKGERENFVIGVPRYQKWIRIKPLADLTIEKLEDLAEKQQLTSRLQEDGRLLVYGKAEDLTEFVRKMSAQASR